MRIFRELEHSEGTDGSAIADDARIRINLGAVRAVVAFSSARGGTGKSALLANVAAALAVAGRKIGIVDADLNAPSISMMLGIKAGRRAFGGAEIEPAAGPLGLRVIGSEFVPEGEPPPVSFADFDELVPVPQNGGRPAELGYLATLRRLLGFTRFGALDLLLVDLAAGIEQFYRLVKLVPTASIVLVSHPSELAARSISSAIGVAHQGSGKVIGVVENMAGFNCDGCHSVRPLTPYGAVGKRTREAQVQLLERLPFDPRLAESCDRGALFVREYGQTPLAKQIVALAMTIDKATAEKPRAIESATETPNP
jgi:ATP-binding protein involved in chromosome partitioning